jgi:putative transcriptional regulator
VAIIVNLDVLLAQRKMKSKELAAMIDITEQNLSLLKSGKVKGIRFSTLDIIEYRQDGDKMEVENMARK